VAEDIENPAGGDTNPSFGKQDSADPLLAQAGSGPSSGADAAPQEDAPKVVKICKKCMVSQSGVGGYCVNCGSELVPIRAVRDSYVGELVGGKYKIVDRLGAGGMGEVYLGLNEPLGQQVAVKFLSRKFTADENIILRFLNEARSYCKVTHPNAVTLLEYGQHEDGALYLITEFIEGKSLSDTLKDVGPFPIDLLISISTQICEVLSAAHGQGVIHRDLKPDNIMLMPTSRGGYAVKVLDFGIAKIMDDDHANGAMTETGSVFGTPEFMSPEQACGDDTDGRSDLYAAGIILFYLATGKLPFKGKNKLVVLHKQLHEAPPLPSQARDDIDVDPELERIILKCLKKPPEQRFQSADELLSALETIDTSKVSRAPRRVLAPRDFQDTNPESPDAADSRDHIETVVRGEAAARLAAQDAGERDQTPGRASADVTQLGDFSGENEPSFVGAFADTEHFDKDEEPDSLGSAVSWDALDEPSQYSPRPSRARGRLIGAAAAALVAGAAVWFFANSPEVGPIDAPAQIDRVLLTGQVLGSLAAAQDSVSHADFQSAQRAVASTYQWIEDAELGEDTRARRVALSAKIDRLIELDTAFSSALGKGDCTRADRILATMSALEASVEQARSPALSKCKASTKSFVPAAAAPSRAPEPPPPAPVDKTPQAPVIAPAAPPAPEPPAVEPAAAHPVAAPTPEPTDEAATDISADSTQPPSSTEESKLDDVMPDITKPTPPAAPAEDSEDSEGSEETDEAQDPGFALPPKTID